MNRILFFFLACLPLFATALAQTAETREELNPVFAPLTKVPSKAAARRNPLQDDPDAVAGGAKLFAQHCAECHGKAGQGARKAPSLMVDEVQQASPGALFWLLTNGVVRRGMPVWSKLPEQQRWQLVSYIQSLNFELDAGHEKRPRKAIRNQ